MFKFDDTLSRVVNICIKKNIIPMLLGEPGIGKSSWLEALAKQNHTKCFTLACNQLYDKADLTGARLVPVNNTSNSQTPSSAAADYKQVFYPHATISDANAYAFAHPREEPILFLDELNRTTADVTSELLSIPTMRSIGSIQLAPNLRVVIAGNDKGNVTALDTASISRFTLFHVEPDVGTFLAIHKDLNPFVKEVLEQHPDTIFCKKLTLAVTNDKKKDDDDDDSARYEIDDIITDGEEMQQIATPRTIAKLSSFLNELDPTSDMLPMLADTHTRDDGTETSTLEELIEGFTGRTNFTAYLMATIAAKAATRNVSASNAGPVVGKPKCYDELKSKTTVSELNDFINTLNDEDKSGCLVYAMFEKVDNSVYIRALAGKTNQLTPDDMRVLMTTSASGELDNQNVDVFIKTNTPIASTLSIILNIA